MPRIVAVTIADDLEFLHDENQVQADEQLVFGFDGKVFEIVLTKHNADAFRKLMQPYATAARPIPGLTMPKLPRERRMDHEMHQDGTSDEGHSGKADKNIPKRLPDGRLIPPRFWEASSKESPSARAKKKEFRTLIKAWAAEHFGVDIGNGRIGEEHGNGWAYAHPELVPPGEEAQGTLV